ncbi:MAG: hypothetical protein K6A72_09635 [Lachnospiraceae bacterium]|nr:hypothetical protein [Lachnospiraceae bacterium]
MASSIDFNDFIVTKSEKEKCEFEVTYKAMEYYIKYPGYDKSPEWKSIVFQNSIYVYYCNKEERSKYENATAQGYKGACLLFNESNNIALTADILTSIYHPFTSLVFEYNSLDGEGLSNLFKNMDIENYSKKIVAIYPYMKAFAKVYYWCGNMMPVICNWRGANDEAVHKIKQLKKEVKEDYFITMKEGKKWKENFVNGRNVRPTELLPSWRNKMWPAWEDFVYQNYLNDYIKDDKIKNISLWDECENDEKRKEWFLNNAKLIIQRSYRIINKHHGKWNEKREDGKTHEEYVKDIMKTIFIEANIPDIPDKPEEIVLF